ncbi:carboxylesterase/lipase family protein [Sunxiuqinia sp. A32]|uniref:carboxylesterase/lipase family protein n=1 Tax=Sunxiuqinia sp. A32 TaxID=3461496 RepID=UPI0040457EF6
MKNSYISRRRFLQLSGAGTTGIVFSGSILTRQSYANESAYVLAETTFGKVRGVESRGIKIFKGIPYGGNTGGLNRFMPPVDPQSWTGVRDALEYGHSAPQSAHWPPKKEGKTKSKATSKREAEPQKEKLTGPSIYKALSVPGGKNTGEGEDCLVLNVWTSAINDGGKRPVMLWLHGGGFRGGSGSNPGWDGTNLCLRGDVVVMTINHRLNVMGFANLSEFSSDFSASGQVGMLDIVHALKWVKKNIEQFGGDPDRVMIFGQSGGGRKCETLLAMPSAKGLFHRAAIHSGIALHIVDKEVALRNAEMLLKKLNLKKRNIHKIQQLPLNQILMAHYEVNNDIGNSELDYYGFAPSVDGTIIPQHPFYPTASSVSPDVPILVGSTRTEWTGLTTDAKYWHLDNESLKVEVQKVIGQQPDEMIDLYQKHNPGLSPSDIFFLIASDFSYGAKTMKVAERRAALGRGPVYLFYFAWESPVQGGMLKSPHNIEWPFAFDNAEICSALTGGRPDAMALADKVSDAWIAFAKTGNPNTSKMPKWNQFENENRATMIIDNESRLVNDPLREQRIAMFRALKIEN